MKKIKAFLILPFLLFATALLATHISKPEPEGFIHATDIKFRTVRDFPPISDKSIFYSGADYTMPGSRSILQQLNPRGILAIDQDFNRYYLPGFVDIQPTNYSLQLSNQGNYRICKNQDCYPITEMTLADMAISLINNG